MNASIDYSDFEVRSFESMEQGIYFMWAGELYQRVAIPGCPGKIDENAIRARDGWLFAFFGEEQVVPVKVNIEVLRGGN